MGPDLGPQPAAAPASSTTRPGRDPVPGGPESSPLLEASDAYGNGQRRTRRSQSVSVSHCYRARCRSGRSIRADDQLVRLAKLLKSRGQRECVRRRYILIRSAVHDENRRVEPLGPIDCRAPPGDFAPAFPVIGPDCCGRLGEPPTGIDQRPEIGETTVHRGGQHRVVLSNGLIRHHCAT